MQQISAQHVHLVTTLVTPLVSSFLFSVLSPPRVNHCLKADPWLISSQFRLSCTAGSAQARDHMTHETCGTGGGSSLLPLSLHDEVIPCVSFILLNNNVSITLGPERVDKNPKVAWCHRPPWDLTLTAGTGEAQEDDSWLMAGCHSLLSYLLAPWRHSTHWGHTLTLEPSCQLPQLLTSCHALCVYSSWP